MPRHLLAAALALAAAAVAPARAPGAPAPDRPNIVLLMADDLGWGDVGFNGNTVIRTPHLDTLARDGLTLTRFYAAAPVCSPTRGSCLTGRHPFRYGVFFANVGHLRPPEITLPELLRNLGYATGHFGKWHLGTLTKTEPDANRGGPKGAAHFAPPQANGFDVCFSTESKVPTWDPMLKPRGQGGKSWWDPVGDPADAEPYGTAYWDETGRRVTENLRGDDSRVIMDRAIPFVEGAARAGRPFFAVVWFHAPHLPVVAGPEHTAPYRDHEPYARHYYGCITALDEQVGRLRAALRKAGAAENTLVAFCADNGPEGSAGKAPGSAGPFRGRKRDLYEGGIRVPAAVAWPARIRPGATTAVPAVTSDYLPTILEIVGVPMPDRRPIDGVSLLPLFDGTRTERKAPIGFESAGQLALVDDRYKLIRPRGRKGGAGAWALYDLIADPGEKTDVADRHPEIVARMSREALAWQASCKKSLDGEDYGDTR